MLTLTDHAAAEIRNLVDHPELPESTGLRIADDNAGSLSLTLAPTPAAEDAVVDDLGARVFLNPTAAALLNDKTLDASTDGTGQVQFTIAQQNP